MTCDAGPATLGRMDIARLAQMDLNLLVAFEALYAEAHVTRAAGRIGISQPALSHALTRLRALFSDPLFLRTPRGVSPTPRAHALALPIRRILRDVEGALEPPRFDPALDARTFRIAAADFGQLVLLPPLLERLGHTAPRADFVVRPVPTDLEAALERGDVDVAFLAGRPKVPRLVAQRLFDERFVSVARKRHPALTGRMTPKRFAALAHLQIAVRGTPGGPVDDALAALGLQRRVVLRVPEFLVAPLLVARSDLVLTAPSRMIEAVGLRALRVFEPPLRIPTFTLWQVWHEGRRQEPAHAWLRQTLLEIARALG